MDDDLKALEQKLGQLIAFCSSLKDENMQLRQTLSQSQQETLQLKQNMHMASHKLEALMHALPSSVLNTANNQADVAENDEGFEFSNMGTVESVVLESKTEFE